MVTLTVNDPQAWNVNAVDVEWDATRPTSVIARQALFNDSTPTGVTGDTSDSGLTALGSRGLAGFTGNDLAASAKGAIHFEWHHGTVAATSGFDPPALTRFDRWTADAEIANGALTLKDNQVKRGAHTAPVQAAVTLADTPRVTFPAPKPASVAIKPAQPKR